MIYINDSECDFMPKKNKTIKEQVIYYLRYFYKRDLIWGSFFLIIFGSVLMLLWLLDPYELLIFLLAFIVLIIGISMGISSYRDGRKLFRQHWRSRAMPIHLYMENEKSRNKHIIIGSILVPIGFITLYAFQSNGSLTPGTGFLGFIIWRSGALLVGFGITMIVYAWLFSKRNL
jgi:hypothetical protein